MSAPVAKKTINPLLAAYLVQLAVNPLRTKAITSGVLTFLQEVAGSHIAGVPPKRVSPYANPIFQLAARAHINTKAFKMGLYGFLVAAPLSHYLNGLLQKFFAGKTGAGAKIGQILASNLLIAPIQTVAFLSSMAIINGAKTLDEVVKTVKAGFLQTIRITWVVSPVSLIIAQKFIPVQLWVPFFNLIQFVLGTTFNAKIKMAKLAQLKKKAEEDREKEQ